MEQTTKVTVMEKLPTNHSDLIHDVQMDYYGKQLASAGSDRLIKIYDVDPHTNQRYLAAELPGHDGPVWQLAWAHPEFGNILASCSYDRQVFVWKEHVAAQWGLVHKYIGHEGSVNAVAFAPREYGLKLACASSDENVSVLTHHGNGQWSATMIKAHKTGVNAVSWAPATDPASGASVTERFVTGGCDNLVKIWRYDDTQQTWVEADSLPQGHTDWVRDVAWAPSIGNGIDVIASCSQDKRVIIWKREGSEWKKQVLEMPYLVWSVSWSATGGILAVAGGDNQVTLWKEDAMGQWLNIGQLSEDTVPEQAY